MGGAEHLILRDGIYHFRRRVPADVAGPGVRRFVWRSTGQRERVAALVAAAHINAELEAQWAALSANAVAAAPHGAARFDAAVKLARALGLAYRPVADLVAGSMEERLARLELLERERLMGSPKAVASALGTVDKPALALSQLFATYEEHVRDRLRGKSDDQLRKWRNPRLRAAANLAAVIGDKPLAEISRDDALDFRAWWMDRIDAEALEPGTANKDLQHLAAMLRAINLAWRLGLDDPFAGLRLREAQYNQRTAYDTSFARDRILSGDGLASLNPEARAIVRIVAATGMRPSEVAALEPARIVLETNIPHLQVRAGAREVKTPAAERDMPLVGLALEIMREHRGGFPRYRDAPDTFSATANKALGAAGLRPTPAHTVYSLRHTFKDRLIALEAPPRVQDALMGHAVGEERYGAGPSLEQRAEWMARVWG